MSSDDIIHTSYKMGSGRGFHNFIILYGLILGMNKNHGECYYYICLLRDTGKGGKWATFEFKISYYQCRGEEAQWSDLSTQIPIEVNGSAREIR